MNAHLVLKYRNTLTALENSIAESETSNPKPKPVAKSKTFGYRWNTVRFSPMFVTPKVQEVH
jgi:hypothetical protein